MIDMELDDVWENQRHLQKYARDRGELPERMKRTERHASRNERSLRSTSRSTREERPVLQNPFRSGSRSRRVIEEKQDRGRYGGSSSSSRRLPERMHRKEVAISKYVEEIPAQKVHRSQSTRHGSLFDRSRGPSSRSSYSEGPRRSRSVSRNFRTTRSRSSSDEERSVLSQVSVESESSGESMDRGHSRHRSKSYEQGRLFSRNNRSRSVDERPQNKKVAIVVRSKNKPRAPSLDNRSTRREKPRAEKSKSERSVRSASVARREDRSSYRKSARSRSQSVTRRVVEEKYARGGYGSSRRHPEKRDRNHIPILKNGDDIPSQKVYRSQSARSSRYGSTRERSNTPSRRPYSERSRGRSRSVRSAHRNFRTARSRSVSTESTGLEHSDTTDYSSDY